MTELPPDHSYEMTDRHTLIIHLRNQVTNNVGYDKYYKYIVFFN